MTRRIDNDTFYLHLDSSIDDENIFPDNNLGDFSVLLPDVIQLKCDEAVEHWEVALESIQLPNCLMNILDGHNQIEYSVTLKDCNLNSKKIKYGKVTTNSGGGITVVCPFFIPTGYMDVSSFLNSVNNYLMIFKQAIMNDFKDHSAMLANGSNPLTMIILYNKSQNKLMFQHNPKFSEQLAFASNKLRSLMGLTTMIVPSKTALMFGGIFAAYSQAEETCNFNRHFQNIIIHCDIVEESVINDKYACILRILDVSTLMARAVHFASSVMKVQKTVLIDSHEIKDIKNNDLLLKTYSGLTNHVYPHHSFTVLPNLAPVFQRLQFFPVSTNILQKISFKLANEFGEDIHFVKTKDVTNIVLCFRKVKNF